LAAHDAQAREKILRALDVSQIKWFSDRFGGGGLVCGKMKEERPLGPIEAE
jgi:hypothetical protein